MLTIYTPHTIRLENGKYIFRDITPGEFRRWEGMAIFDVAESGHNVRASRCVDISAVSFPTLGRRIRHSAHLNFNAFSDTSITFDESLAGGLSYLGYEQISRVPSNLAPYVRLARDNPEIELSVTTSQDYEPAMHTTYNIYKRIDHVVIHKYDRGRERTWITQDYRTRHLVDVD